MKYLGYTQESIEHVLKLLNTLSITGIDQNDAFNEATHILRVAKEIEVKEENQDVN